MCDPLDGQSFHCARSLTVRFKAFDQSQGLPHLVAELLALIAKRTLVEGLLGLGVEGSIKHDIAARTRCREHAEAHPVSPILVEQGERVGRVAKALRHLATLRIAHHTGPVHVLEGRLAGVFLACHHHAGHPEVDDVPARDEHIGRIVVGQFTAGCRLEGLARGEVG